MGSANLTAGEQHLHDHVNPEHVFCLFQLWSQSFDVSVNNPDQFVCVVS